jgi:hypothetical protein
MKTQISNLKEILHENKEDLLYLLLVGVPTAVLMLLFSSYIDYSNLY